MSVVHPAQKNPATISPLATVALLLWAPDDLGNYTEASKANSPRLYVANDPSTVTGADVGTMVVDRQTGVWWRALSDGTMTSLSSTELILTPTPSADHASTVSLVEIAATSPVNTTGTNVLNGLTIDLEIGNASGGTNTVRGLQIDGVTADAQVTDVAINIGAGWTTALAIAAGSVLDLNGTLDQDTALTGTGDGANIAVTMSHATQDAEGLDVTLSQITNVRTSGKLSAIKSTIVSLTGSTAGTDVNAFEAAVTVGDAAVDHFAFKQGAGFDWTMDLSACATTEAGALVASNVADAFHFGNGTLTYWTLKTSTATPGIVEAFTLTATGTAHALTTTVNSAAGVVAGHASSITTASTNHTSGLISAYRATFTSLAGDTGGDFVGLELASVDGGGTTPFHSGIYCATALDALIKVSADGMGGVVVGATMTRSPETDTESGYFRFNVGATVYQVPIYAA